MNPFVDDRDFQLYVGDVREVLAGLPAAAAEAAEEGHEAVSGYTRFRTSTFRLPHRYSLTPGTFWWRVTLRGTTTSG